MPPTAPGLSVFWVLNRTLPARYSLTSDPRSVLGCAKPTSVLRGRAEDICSCRVFLSLTLNRLRTASFKIEHLATRKVDVLGLCNRMRDSSHLFLSCEFIDRSARDCFPFDLHVAADRDHRFCARRQPKRGKTTTLGAKACPLWCTR